MAEPMAIDGEIAPKKPMKRKREKQRVTEVAMTAEERESIATGLNEELKSLFKYFDETLTLNGVDLGVHFNNCSSNNVNAMIAVLLEEKRGSYSKVAVEIYERVRESQSGVTIASVKSSVLHVGKRVAYGLPNSDADVLEDENERALWCWETRDMKLLPSSTRGILKIRRTCRRKIQERISAVSAVLSALAKPEDHQSYKHDLIKALENLSKILKEADIRHLVESLAQKSGPEIVEKDAKKEEKVLSKQLEKSKREAEKEKKKMDRELQKQKLQSEKEMKRLQQEAEKDEKRREKEESEIRKQFKRKQEEAEREQRRKEKEEAEIKKQLSVQKQASIMERFLKRSKSNPESHNDQSQADAPASDSTTNKSDCEPNSVTCLMDCTLERKDDVDMDDIHKSHLNYWRCLGHSIRTNSKQHWGIRRKPKTALIKELKLSSNKEQFQVEDLSTDGDINGWELSNTNQKSCNGDAGCSTPIHKSRRRQLLQFDKSNRPAFYGIWPKKSDTVGSRHPFKKDPELDYDIDSDEEWEEEDPGESLSESDKDEEECLEEGSLQMGDGDESDDGFFVPDGYLSENEGVQTDRNQSELMAEDVRPSPGCKTEAENEECTAWVRKQKCLCSLTEQALRKNQPFIIVNLMHEKSQLKSAEDLTGTSKLEAMCLQALAIRAFPGALPIEVLPDNNLQEEKQEPCTANSKAGSTSTGSTTVIPDSDLPEIVSVIQSSPSGMNKVVESLQQKFPTIPKSHLKNKVREISDFVDNRWQVKKDILDKLGLSSSPEKNWRRTKSIATFFSKRCLPPSAHGVSPCKTTSETLKPGSEACHQQQQQQQENCT